MPTAALHLLLHDCTGVLRPFQGEQVSKRIKGADVPLRPRVNKIVSRLRRNAVFISRNAPIHFFNRFAMGRHVVSDLASPKSSGGSNAVKQS